MPLFDDFLKEKDDYRQNQKPGVFGKKSKDLASGLE